MIVFGAFAQSPVVRGALVIVTALMLQTTMFTVIRPLGIAPDIMLLFCVTAGLVGGSVRGARFSFVAGLAFDLLLSGLLGLSALTYGLAAFVAGLLPARIMEAPRGLRPLVVGTISGAATIFYAVASNLFGSTDSVQLRLLRIVPVVAVSNVVLAPIAVWVQKWALLGGDRTRR